MPWTRTLYICYTLLLLMDSGVLCRTPDDSASLALPGNVQVPGTTPLSATDVPKCFQNDTYPQFPYNCHCRKLSDPTKVICCDIKNLKKGLDCPAIGGLKLVSELHIWNATFEELNITKLNFQKLESLSITNGRISKIIGKFSKHTPIQFLNLSNNAITSIDEEAMVHLTNLRTLDISHNNLSEIPTFNKDTRILVDVSGNNEMECQSLSQAKNKSQIQFVNANRTFCKKSVTFHWFNSTILLSLNELETVDRPPGNCCGNCICGPHRLDISPGDLLTSSLMVNCSDKQLIDIPDVPATTVALNVTNNNITSLQKLQEPCFNNLRELYADNNQITSITDLEGTQFFDNFVALSLRNNKLITIPIYLIINILDINPESKQISLGLNKLICDCNTVRSLKIWLLAKKENFRDYDDILCENFPLKVIEIDVSNVCIYPGVNWIYYVITIEVLLLVCLFIKVSYDYWVFKTAGYLPWPASKMPKLPCDWLCE